MRPSVKQPYYYIINIDDPSKKDNTYNDQKRKEKVKSGEEERYGNAVLPIM
jgi:hypothetical protein